MCPVSFLLPRLWDLSSVPSVLNVLPPCEPPSRTNTPMWGPQIPIWAFLFFHPKCMIANWILRSTSAPHSTVAPLFESGRATVLKVHLCGPHRSERAHAGTGAHEAEVPLCEPLQLHGPLYLYGPFRFCVALLDLYDAFQYHMGPFHLSEPPLQSGSLGGCLRRLCLRAIATTLGRMT